MSEGHLSEDIPEVHGERCEVWETALAYENAHSRVLSPISAHSAWSLLHWTT